MFEESFEATVQYANLTFGHIAFFSLSFRDEDDCCEITLALNVSTCADSLNEMAHWINANNPSDFLGKSFYVTIHSDNEQEFATSVIISDSERRRKIQINLEDSCSQLWMDA